MSAKEKWSTWKNLTRTASGETPMLDLVRAAAIGMVLLQHYWQVTRIYVPPVPQFLDMAVYNMSAGVGLFFSLSGFLIARGLHREFTQNGRLDMASFYARRFFRIFPAYYFFLLVSLAFVAGNEAKLEKATGISGFGSGWYFDFLFVSNFFQGLHGHTWSLSIEEQFYLVFPAMALLLFRLSKRNLLFAVCGLYFIPLLFRIYSVIVLPPDQYGARAYAHTLARFDDILIGILVSLSYTDIELKPYARKLLLVFSLALCFAGLSLPPDVPDAVKVIKPNMLNLSFGAFVYLGATSTRGLPGFITATAKLSYSLYLWNMVAGLLGVSGIMRHLKPGVLVSWSIILKGFVYAMLSSYLIAFLSYRFIEVPFLRLRDRFRKRPPEGGAEIKPA